ncbi:DUF262 domain-containing protein [Myxococcota bacterium]|nr:DUF262 domain-containing protein [Myxococcota bacterium]
MSLPSLPEHPRAESLKVEDLISRAEKGRLRVPDFQRPLRWTSENVLELFDSIVRGFPIGSLLLWSKDLPPGVQRFGPVEVQAPAQREGLLLVDGQQRVTALIGALRHPMKSPCGGVYSVWVNLKDYSFKVMRTVPTELAWLPLNVLGDRKQLHQWSRTIQAGVETEELINRAFELEKLIMSYALPAYIVVDAPLDVLKLIFSRVNHAGVALKDSEVFSALFGAEEDQPLARLAEELHQNTGFGQLSQDWLLRCVRAVHDPNPRREFSEKDRPDSKLINRVLQALTRACDFIITEAEFPHSALLPYRGALIVLARLFDMHARLTPRDSALLVRWLWRGALSGVHANTSNEVIHRQLMDIGEDPTESVQRLLDRVPRELRAPDPTATWNGGAANTRFFAAAMCSRLIRTDMISLRELQAELEAHPLGELFQTLDPSHGKTIASRVWKAKRYALRSDQQPPLFSGAPDPYGLVLDDLMLSALEAGDQGEFIAQRARALRDELDGMIKRLAAPGENDRPAIAYLMGGAA